MFGNAFLFFKEMHINSRECVFQAISSGMHSIDRRLGCVQLSAKFEENINLISVLIFTVFVLYILEYEIRMFS